MKRRNFLSAAAAAAATGCRRSSPGTGLRTLTDAEAMALRVLCRQIIPPDDITPGADWAGAVQFIDIQLSRRYRAHREAYRRGIARAEALAQARFGRPLNELVSSEQLTVAEELEKADPAFFNLLVAHTMQSYYGSPRHGGNRDAVSWRMLGLAPVQIRGRRPGDNRKGSAT